MSNLPSRLSADCPIGFTFDVRDGPNDHEPASYALHGWTGVAPGVGAPQFVLVTSDATTGDVIVSDYPVWSARLEEEAVKALNWANELQRLLRLASKVERIAHEIEERQADLN